MFRERIKNALIIDLAVRLGTKDIITQARLSNSLYINTAIDIWPEKSAYQSIWDVKQSIL